MTEFVSLFFVGIKVIKGEEKKYNGVFDD